MSRHKKADKSCSAKLQSVYEDLKNAYRELKDSHIEMVFRMAVMAEYRDPSTGAHLVRLADYSSIIAEGLGLPKKEVEIVRYAAPMHDIGKIMLPDSVLKKKGAFNPEEEAIMRKHPEIGADIFKNAKSALMKACGVVALTHHERFDGTGYPNGLKGEDIPLYGRIVAVADVFDALVSRRSYKDIFDLDRSISILMEGAGKHFDPAVVMSFIRKKEKILEILQANKDIENFLEDMGITDETFLT